MKEYESIKAKLLKLQALVEKGYKGEAIAAKRMLENLCSKYGISIEDILQEQEQVKIYKFDVGKSKHLKLLFKQCYFKILNKREISYYRWSNSILAVELTPFQYAELSNLFEWHKENFKRDVETTLESIAIAYINKHDLFAEQSGDNKSDVTVSPEEYKKIMASVALMDQLSDNTYHKMIDQK